MQVMYQSFAQPRAVLWQMYVVTAAIIYACMGIAYTLSQVSQENLLKIVLCCSGACPLSKTSTICLCPGRILA